jgi:hypothetical protein
MKLQMNIDGSALNTEERRLKAQVVRGEMALIWNSPEFRVNLLTELETMRGELSKWKSATPVEIFDYLMDGSEILDPIADGEMDLLVDDYYTRANTVGYTKPGTKYIFVNTRYFDTNSSKKCGSNFSHEYGHKKGFSHDSKDTDRRDFSICYIINKAYEKTWDELLGTPAENDKVLVCKKFLIFWQRCYWVKTGTATV